MQPCIIKVQDGFYVNSLELDTDEHFEFIEEEGREIIYEWAKKRQKKSYQLLKNFMYYILELKVVLDIFNRISFMAVLNIILTNVFIFLCTKYDLKYYFHATIFSVPLIFPLSFVINSDYQRRELTLNLLGDLRGRILTMYIHCRDMAHIVKKENVFLHVHNKLLQLVMHVSEYLSTNGHKKQHFISKVIYEDFSDLEQLFAMLLDVNPGIPPGNIFLIRLCNVHETCMVVFERLKVLKETRTPYTTRSLTKLMSFIIPLLFTPLFVYFGDSVPSTKTWSPYVWGSLVSFIFGTLQSLQDRLYDPFLGLSRNVIDLKDTVSWTVKTLVNLEGRSYVAEDLDIKKFIDVKKHPANQSTYVGENEKQRAHVVYMEKI